MTLDFDGLRCTMITHAEDLAREFRAQSHVFGANQNQSTRPLPDLLTPNEVRVPQDLCDKSRVGAGVQLLRRAELDQSTCPHDPHIIGNRQRFFLIVRHHQR